MKLNDIWKNDMFWELVSRSTLPPCYYENLRCLKLSVCVELQAWVMRKRVDKYIYKKLHIQTLSGSESPNMWNCFTARLSQLKSKFHYHKLTMFIYHPINEFPPCFQFFNVLPPPPPTKYKHSHMYIYYSNDYKKIVLCMTSQNGMNDCVSRGASVL
jgi:hypothetical protein